MHRLFIMLLTLFSAWPVTAHEGHEHNDLPPLPTQTLSPRVTAQSEEFELVGVVQDQELIIYLDNWTTNEPLTQAQIEVESGAFKEVAQATSTGTYRLPLKQLLTPGQHELMFTIETSKVSDLLLGELHIVPPSIELPQAPPSYSVRMLNTWQTFLHIPSSWLLGMVLTVFVLMIYFCRSTKRPPEEKSSPVLILIIALFLFYNGFSSLSVAHEGETHEEEKPSLPDRLSNDAPSRLADGSILVPKAVQHLLGIRTQVAKVSQVSPSLELNGHIIPDPNYSGRVQAPLAGWLEMVPQGLPHLGETVQKGQILAYLHVITANVDRADRQAELANLDGQIDIFHNNLERLKQLGTHAARKELDETMVELNSLKMRREAIGQGLSTKLPLIAPVTGVIATHHVLPGQVVEARDILFEIVDPEKFWVEALIYETALAEQLGPAQAVTASHQTLPLTLVGLSYQLREHALPVQFRIEPPLPLLSVEQPVKVFVQTKQSITGITLPNSAVLKHPRYGNLVWIHERPEYFKPLDVQTQTLDGNHVVVTAGLQVGARVVVHGASLLSQIR